MINGEFSLMLITSSTFFPSVIRYSVCIILDLLICWFTKIFMFMCQNLMLDLNPDKAKDVTLLSLLFLDHFA